MRGEDAADDVAAVEIAHPAEHGVEVRHLPHQRDLGHRPQIEPDRQWKAGEQDDNERDENSRPCHSGGHVLANRVSPSGFPLTVKDPRKALNKNVLMHDEAHIIKVQSGSAREWTPLDAFPEPLHTIFTTSLERSERLLAEDFKGLTTDGKVVPGLFPVQKTGVTLQPVVDAVRRFQDSLNPVQRETAAFGLDSQEWRKWHNMHVCFYRPRAFACSI